MCVFTDVFKRQKDLGGHTQLPGGGYFLIRRTFVIYKDATSSLPNLHQGVGGLWSWGGILDQNGISWNHKSGKAQLVCIRSFFSKYFDIAQH